MILGIDPGLNNVGWAVLKDEETLVAWGCIENKKGEKTDKLGKIFEEVQRLVKKYQIKTVAIEDLFFAKNKKSALAVAEAMGVIKIAAIQGGARVREYTPLKVKMSVVGYGRADKDQILDMVKRILGVEEQIKPDHAADAVAVALTCLFDKSLG
jgi:crossover junction endodeoxyribonuclease RuvC